MTIMVDGIGTDVPAILARFGRSRPVGGYIWQPGVLSEIPWTAAQLAEFPAGHILTATLPESLELAAQHARELDVETGDADAADAPTFLIARHDHGHKDGQVYSDMFNLGGVLAHIRSAGIYDEPWWRLRVAWWWQRPGAPTLDHVMREITDLGVTVEPSRIWGCQYFAGGSYDLTAVYGVPDFTRP